MFVGVRICFVLASCIIPHGNGIDVEKGIDHAGQDFPGMPLTLSQDDYMDCFKLCNNNASACTGWVFKPKNCTSNEDNKSWPAVPLCWLKNGWSNPVKNICRISGLLEGKSDCSIAVHTNQVTHTVNPMHMGCHSDSGYAHEARGLSAQMIYGNSFERVPDMFQKNPSAWNNIIDAGVNATLILDSKERFNGLNSQRITYYSSDSRSYRAKSRAGVANRGFGNEGLVLTGGKPYEGYFFIKSASTVDVTVALEDYIDDDVLASKVITFGGGNWTKVDFELTPTHSTDCVGIDNVKAEDQYNITCPINNTYNPGGRMSDRSAHICVRCSGQLVITIAQPISVWLDFVYLQPGTWGRFSGLPVRLDSVKSLQEMGISLIRQGGSFAKGGYYLWKKWRGPRYLRPSVSTNWGHDVLSGWGPFEMIDLCNAMDIIPVITTTSSGTTEDMGDLVEYCWGDKSTKWGAQRIADGHPHVYNVSYFELGNEEYNSHYVEQVKAMEERANTIGIKNKLYYIFPNNQGPTGADAVAAKALGLGSRLVVDIHDGAKGGVNNAKRVFANNNTDTWGAINLETNCGDHTMHRAIEEAQDFNDFFSFPNPRLLGRAGSFCMERSGYNEAGLNDQGISFFLPNMTWLQPPGYVHAMISSSWQPLNVNFTATGRIKLTTQDVSVQTSIDKTTVVVRFVNSQTFALNVTISFPNKYAPDMNVHMSSLFTSNPAGPKTSNTPADPKKVSPISKTIAWSLDQPIVIPPYSYNVLTFTHI